jgi:hypothetical protein
VTPARFTLVVTGLLALTLPAVLAACRSSRIRPRTTQSAIALGAGLAVLNTVVAYGLARAAERRPPKAFVTMVLGGMLARMACLLAAVVLAILGLGVPQVPLVLALLGDFVPLLVFELVVLQRRPAARTETR